MVIKTEWNQIRAAVAIRAFSGGLFFCWLDLIPLCRARIRCPTILSQHSSSRHGLHRVKRHTCTHPLLFQRPSQRIKTNCLIWMNHTLMGLKWIPGLPDLGLA
ncbi:hypothetical protein QBC38DRAFT_14336 [Podospora fimiseda]|uniref:Uncharacterized protein n=1 Tax=Podospora fimiseda TaxID=252190 RepID=A0AAN7BJU3_9PEZI|nr:hypothetical protein QBC38DRAFT_14336 [Podospora fimiseda]